MLNLPDRNQTRYFNYKKRTLWNGSHLVGISLVSIALIIWITSNFIENETDPFTLYMIVGIFLFLGILSLSTYSGILIEFDRSRFKEYQSVFWFKIGEWKELPKIEHAEFILHSFRATNIPNGITPTLSGEVTIYKCVLLANGTKFLALDYGREKDAVVAIEEIREALGI
ncbi:hypothetical protein [uncultured Algoriphagus sp.]|uniref:hypothetical protein n=1 Tax=uncultured Algoriphagus sp. TaxID=417365 RepID=UPI0030EDD6AE|tara:strand:+ start:35106 stop:35615 length:510 start_codon:yes stop_codon:yes gene_type:complete